MTPPARWKKAIERNKSEYSGYYANPTYIVLDSTDQLEVTRGSFTNSSDEFGEFLAEGLLDRPAFESRIQFDGLTIVEHGSAVTVLQRQQPWSYEGQQAGQLSRKRCRATHFQFFSLDIFPGR